MVAQFAFRAQCVVDATGVTFPAGLLRVRRPLVAQTMNAPGTTNRRVTTMFLPSLFEANLEDFPQDGLPRLRFVACRMERAAAAMTRVTVELDGPVMGQRINTKAEGSTCVGGDMRLAAQAMLDALMHATKGVLRFELVGVKPIRAFDTNVVVAAVMVHGDGMSRRLVGTAIVDEDAITGAALAALNATNRVVSPLLLQEATALQS
jgi:hypothetical protein